MIVSPVAGPATIPNTYKAPTVSHMIKSGWSSIKLCEPYLLRSVARMRIFISSDNSLTPDPTRFFKDSRAFRTTKISASVTIQYFFTFLFSSRSCFLRVLVFFAFMFAPLLYIRFSNILILPDRLASSRHASKAFKCAASKEAAASRSDFASIAFSRRPLASLIASGDPALSA